MLKAENLRFLGLLGVDAGTFTVMDPLAAPDLADVVDEEPGYVLDHGIDFVTVAPTPRGDGLFEVFAVLDDEGAYVGAYIDFTQQFERDDIDHMFPAPAGATA
ncbi:hypothetical protein ACFY7A_35665 [Streptomyces longwoodensis]|uniref:hypothetical protein n=1 Tax=Streptomyces longwoodensis TaxID=68231 RepID=UPI0036BD568B